MRYKHYRKRRKNKIMKEFDIGKTTLYGNGFLGKHAGATQPNHHYFHTPTVEHRNTVRVAIGTKRHTQIHHYGGNHARHN